MMPDFWVVIEMNGEDHHFRLCMAWRGGYLDGDSWIINSGIVSCTYDKKRDTYTFTGVSGSSYECLADRYGVGGMIAGILDKMNDNKMPVKVLPKDTNWANKDWLITEKSK